MVADDEADVIREVAGRLLAGESLAGVCDDLDQRGVTTPAGGRWRTSTLRHTMLRPMLAGLRVYHGEVIADGDWEAIITREQHDQLVARFSGKGSRHADA